VEDGVRTLLEMLGVHAACAVVAGALRAVAIQYQHEWRELFGVAGDRARDLATLLGGLAELAGEEPVVREEAPGRVVLERTPRLFADGEAVPAEVHEALFALPRTCAKLHGARVRLSPAARRPEGAARDVWLVEDVKGRLF
jgi:hypothetical protein